MKFTARVDGEGLFASSDDGRTAHIDVAANRGLRAALQAVEHAIAESGDYNVPSAVARASVEEAIHLRPTSDDPPGRHPIASATGIGSRIPLGTHLRETPRESLRDVLSRRRSRRSMGPASLDDVAALLVRAGRTRMVVDMPGGGQAVTRPYPSAGARHPNELVLAAHDIEGLDSGWWWFDAFACELAPITVEPSPEKALSTLAEVASLDLAPTAAVFAVAAFRRTLSRYPAGTSLVWRDAGVVLATLHLEATELGLASCIVGSCGMIHLDGLESTAPVVDVGAVTFGANQSD